MSKIEVVEKTELQLTVERYLALPEGKRSRVVVVPDFQGLLQARYGAGGVKDGPPTIVSEIERTIDSRPCDPFRPEDCEHDEAPGVASGDYLYSGWGGPVGPYEASDDPQRPVADDPEPVLMPASWWQHLKWSLARRWPRVFARLTVRWVTMGRT